MTGQQATRRALLESEERFLQLAETVKEVFWITEARRGKVIYVSSAYKELWGRPSGHVLKDPESQYKWIHSEDRARVRASRDRYLASGCEGDWTEEYRILRPDGSLRWVWERFRPIRDQAGQVTRLVGISQDVTDRKRADDRIQALARFPDENTNPVLRVAEQGVLMYANEAASVLLTSWGSSVGSPVPGDVRSAAQAAFRAGRKREIQTECGDRAFSISMTPVPDAGYVNLYAVDITERLRAEREARFQRTLLAAQGEAAIDGITIVSEQGKWLSVNRRFIDMWGLPKEVAEARSKAAFQDWVKGQVAEPEAYLARLRYLYAHPDEESRDEIVLKDGRIFDRYGAPRARR